MMDFSSYERLGFERRGRELRITIENGRLNAVDFPMHEELARVFYEVQQDAESDLIVLTGAGRTFCAGGARSPRKTARISPRVSSAARSNRASSS